MKQTSKSDNNKGSLANIHYQIQELEEKGWYGTALLIIVSALILISTILNGVLGFEESSPIIIVNGLLIVVHMVLVYLSKTDKLIAYGGGLLVFFVGIVLNLMLTGSWLLGGVYLSLVIATCYIVFIYQAQKLKKLRKQLAEL